MAENGWVRSYRTVMEKSWYKKPEYSHLWHHLILKANHKEKPIIYKNKEFVIKRGQFVTSREKLSCETGINPSKIQRILNFFKIEHQIEQQAFSTFRLITVINYDKYQKHEPEDEQRVNSERTASEQRVNTTNNDKNEKNEKKKSTAQTKITFSFEERQWKNITEKDIETWMEAYPACDIWFELKKMKAWLVANPKKRKTQYKRFINSWLSRAQDRGGSSGKIPAGDKDLEHLLGSKR
jgi:hypothetical protein